MHDEHTGVKTYKVQEEIENLRMNVVEISSFYLRHPEILEAAVNLVINERGLTAPFRDLTEQDLFFREVRG